jgi:serine/threonine-protein kinase HipA
MGRAYIYMQLPDRDDVVTLGRLEIVNGVGEFAYSPEFVESQGWVPDSFHYSLRNEFHSGITTNAGIPGFIRDAMPDGWGQRVMAKAAGAELSAIEYLLKSTNQDRSGTLMVGRTRKPPKGVGQSGIGDITTLEDFIAFADGVQGHFPRPINAPARQAARHRSSLGGARPKCSLRHESRLILAKPRDRHDDFDVPSLEHACMTFAASKGLRVARTQLHIGSKSVLLVDRFDRVSHGGNFRRIPMLSALTLLDSDWLAADRGRWRYAAVADEMRRRGVPQEDLHEFYKRMCFNALAGNDDDHPKNHAIIWVDGGWRLSPMYDVVPTLDGESPSSLAMAVGNEGALISRTNLLSHADHFGLGRGNADAILDEVTDWEDELRGHYEQHLSEPERGLAIAAMGARRMRA